jgi:serine/threonine protein kinase
MPELTVVTGPQKGQTFLLRPPGPFHLGRDDAAEFSLFDQRSSRQHFRIELCDEGYRLTDLKSKAGTYVNERKVENVILAPGDRIQAGKTVLTFDFDPPPDPKVGREIGGYRILERVGRGGMGTVYRALQLSLERVVALKVLSEELSSDKEFSMLFIREARAAGELSHPHIVRVYDVNSLDGVLFYAMELMARGSVEDLIRREGPLPLGKALEIAIQAARGLEYAEHEGIVHRDIKPSNLMIHESGVIKIGDLGIATRSRDRGGAGRSRGISGSPHYMAPEQVLGRDVDIRADIYALGASLFQALVGFPPFKGKSLKEILAAHIEQPPPDIRTFRPGIPEPLAILLGRMLAKDPGGRPAAAAELRKLFEGIEASREVLPPPPPRPAFEKAARGLTLVAAMVLALLIGIGTGLLFRYMRREMHDRSDRIDRVKAAISEGHEALGKGDIERALRKVEEISRLSGSRDEWDLLGPEIDALERAVKARGAGRGPPPEK